MSHRLALSRDPILGLAAGVLLLTTPLPAQQPRPEGEWHLVTLPAESLPPRPRPITASEIGPGRPDFGSPGIGGPAGLGGPGGGAGRPPGRATRDLTEKDLLRMRQTIRLGYAAPVTVRILRAEQLLVTVDSSGSERRLPIGRTTELTAADSSGATGRVETSVRWRDDALLVEHRVEGGGKVRESYGVGLDGSRMVVFVEIDAGPIPTSFRRQYRREE